jgi:hypothetical protein
MKGPGMITLFNNNNQLSGIGRNLKTEGIALLVQYYTGERPIVKYHDDYNEISFTPAQATQLRSIIEKWESAEPGEIRVNVRPVLLPWVIKRYGLIAAGLFAGGALLGYLTKR